MKYESAATLLTLCWLAGSSALHGCASPSANAPSPNGSTLLGRWVTRLAGAACDFEIELLQDGSARSNYLNDDSTQQQCEVHSLRFSAGTPASDSLDFWRGSQVVRYCFYQLSGPNLALVCDEHGLPNRATPPLLFSRAATPVTVTSSPGGVIGVWRSGGATLEFMQDGRLLWGGSTMGYRLLSGSELELLHPHPERCSYQLRGGRELVLDCASTRGNIGPLILRR